MPGGYEPAIGLEVHCQLRTRTKLFCPCRVTFGEVPNRSICPVCVGLPGVLPVLNRIAVGYALKAAVAFGCRVAGGSRFSRKNYFYPDLPKGYQITQYEEPLSVGGALEFRCEGEQRRVAIRRLHLEEEAGKMIHSGEEGVSWVDFNRAGIHLIEVVTEPTIRSPKEASLFLHRLRQVILYLGISDCRMEEGSLRCDANVSVRPLGSERLGVRTELKNMNSFRALEDAIAYEIGRQVRILETGGSVAPATLLWDEEAGKIIPLREKEGEEDYRYFPEPDLPPIVIDGAWLEAVGREMPELPWAREGRFRAEYGLPETDIGILTADPELADYYEEVLKGYPDPRTASHWVMGEVLARVKAEGVGVRRLKVKPRDLSEILALMAEGIINRTIAKAVFQEVAETGSSPREVVRKRGWRTISDVERIEEVVRRILVAEEVAVEQYRSGKRGVFTYLVGRVMGETGGEANPSIVNRILKKMLDAR